MVRQRVDPILVVEDSDEDFDTLKQAAERMSLRNEIVRARDAEAACRLLLQASAARRAYSFMVLDQALPGMNGERLLRELRDSGELSRSRTLPVVVLSGSTRTADRDGCYEAGANAYHVKPLRFEEHLEIVQTILRYWSNDAVLPGRGHEGNQDDMQ